MKRSFLTILFGIALGHSCSSAQSVPTRIGIGVSLNPTALIEFNSSSTAFLPVGFTDIYVPIDAIGIFRLEPELGMFKITSEDNTPATYYSQAYSSKSTGSTVRLGMGFLFLIPKDSTFDVYVGPRIGYLLSSDKSSSTDNPVESTTKETDVYFGLALGGEYFISPHFSLGAEIQFNYVDFGQPDVSPASTATQSRIDNIATNNALIFFRWFF